jgi:tape measure domain-containing protein
MAFSDLTVKLKGDITDFANKMKRAATIANSTADTINKGVDKTANKSKFAFKDVARIVQGIIISKAFYGGLNSIRNCTDAVMEFSEQLEYAHMAYSNLFGDTELASEFINVLKDFAATTPFDFTQSEAAAKRLLAYGIQYKNVMYVMQGIMSASAAQNNPAIIESVSRAMGQIYTKGRLMNEEMRQLAEAGIPVYEILKEKLGLTQDQLQNLGKEAIPASKAINALVDGMNERFGGVVANSTKTLPGIISNIKDNALMVSSGVFEPLYQKIKKTAGAFGDFVYELRTIYELQGLGGIFERIIPRELQSQIRVFVANLMNLWTVIKIHLSNAFEALKHIAYALLTVFNAFAPILTIVSDIIAVVTQAILNNATAMKWLTGLLIAAATAWVLFKLKAVSALVVTSVVSAITKSIAILSSVLTIAAKHPFWTILITIGAVLVGLSGGFNKLGSSIQNVFAKLSALNGVNPNQLFMRDNKKRDSDLNKFNQRLDTTADAMANVGDASADAAKKAKKAAEDANKAIKGLLSFDEVFKLKEPDQGTDSGITTPDVTDIGDVGEIPSLDLGDSLIPEIPDFSDVASDFVNGFIGELKDKFISAGIGSIIGGLLGGILGGPLGLKIGSIAGAIAGWFWDDLCNALGIGDTGKITIPIATLLGTAIGKAVGHPLIGAAIGTLIGLLIDGISTGLSTGDWSGVSLPIGIGLGAAIGAMVGHPLIGAGIGALVGWIGKNIIEGFQTGSFNWTAIATPLGSGIGAAIGFVAGGPIGALIGGAICTLVGWIASKFIEADWGKVAEAFTRPFKQFGESVSELFGLIWEPIKTAFDNGDWLSLGANIIAGIIKGFVGAIVTVLGAIATFFKAVWDGFCEIFGIHSPAAKMEPIGKNILLGVLNGLLGAVSTVLKGIANIGAKVISAIGNWFVDIGKSVSSWASDTFESITGWISDTSGAISDWVSDSVGTFAGWASDTGNAIYEWTSSRIEDFSNWASTTGKSITGWVSDKASDIAKWASDTGRSISGWVSDRVADFAGWASNTGNSVSGWVSNNRDSLSTWVNETGSSIAGWASTRASDISGWVSSTGIQISAWVAQQTAAFTGWCSSTGGSIGGWVKENIANFKEFASANAPVISKFTSEMAQKISSFATKSANKIYDFAQSSENKLSSWSSKIANKAYSATSDFSKYVSYGMSNAYRSITGFCSDAMSSIRGWASSFGSWISSTISSAAYRVSSWVSSARSSISGVTSSTYGHATGGVFNREHIARFSEGNKAEAIIPLENKKAMQPFVDAVADGLTSSLGPIFASISNMGSNNVGSTNQLQPLYVGTLIADDRSLRELQKRMDIIRVDDNTRRGL